jgi:hypothetical protein
MSREYIGHTRLRRKTCFNPKADPEWIAVLDVKERTIQQKVYYMTKLIGARTIVLGGRVV